MLRATFPVHFLYPTPLTTVSDGQDQSISATLAFGQPTEPGYAYTTITYRPLVVKRGARYNTAMGAMLTGKNKIRSNDQINSP